MTAVSTAQAAELLNMRRPKLMLDPAGRELLQAADAILSRGLPTLEPLLPCLLRLKGKPFNLDRHFPFEPFYNTLMPKKVVLKSGRQVSKSTSLAAQGIISSNSIPFFNTLYITPLYEMVRRFSSNYVKDFIEQSPFKKLWTNTKNSANVLQRTFRNNSTMFFSYAFMNADRTRGVPADRVSFDEVQDLDPSFIPIIENTLSGSPWELQQFAGTSKTTDNTLEKLWEKSSQGEWMVPCLACGRENWPSLTLDLDAMIGPWRDDISVHNPAVICARPRCRKPIDPSAGRWVHKHPDRLETFTGYHVPQIIMPFHYGDQDKWAVLCGKREGRFNTGTNVFYNEVCGEAYDSSAKLVSLTDIKKAAILPWKNDLQEAKQRMLDYDLRIMSADWGGGGMHGGKHVMSWTVFTIMGWKNDGSIDVIYSHRSLTPHDADREGKILCSLLNDFKCHFFVHDFNGAGRYREKVAIDAGYPFERVVPIWYVPSLAQRVMKYVPVSENNSRALYRLDKPRSLVLTCGEIRRQRIKFFEYDNYGDDNPGVLDDFLALIEDKIDSRMGRDVYTIVRDQGHSDDFAHTVNMGACFFWEHFGAWPDLAEAARYSIDDDLLQWLSPREPDWQ